MRFEGETVRIKVGGEGGGRVSYLGSHCEQKDIPPDDSCNCKHVDS